MKQKNVVSVYWFYHLNHHLKNHLGYPHYQDHLQQLLKIFSLEIFVKEI